jgi:hypothetical protein
MNRLLRALAVLLLVAGLVWLLLPHRRPTPKPLDDFQVVEEWLHCIDCRGSFIERMRAIPASRSDTITRFLRSALVHGPDSARTRRLTQDLWRTWRADSLYRAGHGLPSDTLQTEFFARYRRGFEVMWRGRAATALGVIRNPLALAALDSGLTLPLMDKGDSMIRRMVERAKADTSQTGVTPPHP